MESRVCIALAVGIVVVTVGLLTSPALSTSAGPAGVPQGFNRGETRIGVPIVSPTSKEVGHPTAAGAPGRDGTVLYVDDDADPGGDGLTWPTAFTHLRDARDWAFFHPEVDEIRVAGGTYYPDRDAAHPEGSGIRDWTFQLLNGVALYGGYCGLAGGCDPDDRDIDAFESTLSGNIGSSDLSTDNSYHVVSGTGKDSTAIIDGFTITAGRADGSAPHDDGAGFINAGGSPVISNCTFTDNYAADDAAGMWYTGEGVDYVLTSCTFTGNYAVDDGGGMWFESEGANVTLTDCTFTDNSCASSTAGAEIYNCSTVTVTGCTFSNNSSNGHGGGLGISTCDGVNVTECTFTNNSANHRGGGLGSFNAGHLYLTDCSFDGNSVSTTSANNGKGGAAHCDDTITADNCTFTGNSAASNGNYVGDSGRGGALHTYGSMVLTNCTFTDNTATGTGSYGDSKGLGGAVFSNDLTASDCTFTSNGAYANGYGATWCGRGGAILTQVDATLARCTFTDNEAKYWHNYGYDSNAQGGGICATTVDATDCEFVGNSVWHAGEWGAKGGAAWAVSATLDDCSFSTNGASGSGSYDGYGGAVFVNDGTTLATNCTFDGNSAEWQGGAMYLYYSADTITDCTFTENTVSDAGGGAIYRDQGGGGGTISGCLFQGNTCDGHGGAIRWYDAALDLDNCTFEGNTAASSGGALYHDGSCQSITDCTFIDNEAEVDGGAILLDEGCSPTISGCLFLGNAALEYGGALACADGSSPTIVNSLLDDNHADIGGGGGYFFNGSDAALVNLTFWGNTAGFSGGAVYIDNCLVSITNGILWEDSAPSWPEVYDSTWQVEICYCCIQGGWPYCEGNIDADPLFVDTNGPDDTPGTVDDNLRLLPDSPCIDAGTNGAAFGTDLEGNPRIVDGDDDGEPVVDMGAYEYAPGCPYIYDLDGSCFVDATDLGLFAACWLLSEGADGWDENECADKDFDCSGTVDAADLGLFAGAWLKWDYDVDPADYPECRPCGAGGIICPWVE